MRPRGAKVRTVVDQWCGGVRSRLFVAYGAWWVHCSRASYSTGSAALSHTVSVGSRPPDPTVVCVSVSFHTRIEIVRYFICNPKKLCSRSSWMSYCECFTLLLMVRPSRDPILVPTPCRQHSGVCVIVLLCYCVGLPGRNNGGEFHTAGDELPMGHERWVLGDIFSRGGALCHDLAHVLASHQTVVPRE